ncbi:MAG: class I SAM-dependent methyltransferase [Candidatus Hydrogenedentes bacterium]|nr:class I SAM-dependent methyltransferase [Candidatus Hydrogenedentota bacterium]
MQHEWLVVHRETEAHYWWFINKRRFVLQLLARHAPARGTLLELGCGGGLFSSILAEQGWRVISSDVAEPAVVFAHKQGVPEGVVFDAGRGWPLAADSIDVFIMLDVLEHVKDHAAAMAEACRVLRPGGVGIIAVPAYPFLFSPWDEYNRHFRRYTTGTLVAVVQSGGLHVLQKTYWNAITLLPAIAVRWKERVTQRLPVYEGFPPVRPIVNRLLILLGRMECAWLRLLPLPAGLSAVVTVRKDPDAS